MFKPELKSHPKEDICILLQLDNHAANYICECGDASGLGVKDAQNADAIFLSHTHIDHFINFDTILRHQIGGGKRVVICGPQHITAQVQAKIKGYSWNLIEAGAIVYEVREIVDEHTIIRSQLCPPLWEIEPLKPLDEAGIYGNDRFDVQFTILDHKLPSIAYLFREKDSSNIDLSQSPYKPGSWVRELKSAFESGSGDAEIQVGDDLFKASELFHLVTLKKGDSIGIVMDHAATEANHEKIRTLFSGCNKVFVECFYKAADRELAVQNFHSYSEQSGKIMRECGVNEAIPVHFSRKYTEQDLEEIVQEFNDAFKRDGM